MSGAMLEGWKDFYVAVASAASALAGLVFVALSINLDRILSIPGLPARGAETVILLAAALMVSLVALIPGQSPLVLGLELGAVGVIAWGVPVALQIMTWRGRTYPKRWQFRQRASLHQAATLPLLVGSAAMIVAANGAPYWVALGVVLSLCLGLVNAWVLLVEILR
jgi:hypothetical protein